MPRQLTIQVRGSDRRLRRFDEVRGYLIAPEDRGLIQGRASIDKEIGSFAFTMNIGARIAGIYLEYRLLRDADIDHRIVMASEWHRLSENARETGIFTVRPFAQLARSHIDQASVEKSLEAAFGAQAQKALCFLQFSAAIQAMKLNVTIRDIKAAQNTLEKGINDELFVESIEPFFYWFTRSQHAPLDDQALIDLMKRLEALEFLSVLESHDDARLVTFAIEPLFEIWLRSHGKWEPTMKFVRSLGTEDRGAG